MFLFVTRLIDITLNVNRITVKVRIIKDFSLSHLKFFFEISLKRKLVIHKSMSYNFPEFFLVEKTK